MNVDPYIYDFLKDLVEVCNKHSVAIDSDSSHACFEIWPPALRSTRREPYFFNMSDGWRLSCNVYMALLWKNDKIVMEYRHPERGPFRK